MDESFCGLFTCGGQFEIGVSLFFSFEVSFDHGFGPRGGGPVAFFSHHLHLFRLPSHRHFLSQVRGTCERGDGCHGGAHAHPQHTVPRLLSPALTHPPPHFTTHFTTHPSLSSSPLSGESRGERSTDTGTGTGGSTWPFSLLLFLLYRSWTRGGKERVAPGAVDMAIVKVEGIHRLCASVWDRPLPSWFRKRTEEARRLHIPSFLSSIGRLDGETHAHPSPRRGGPAPDPSVLTYLGSSRTLSSLPPPHVV